MHITASELLSIFPVLLKVLHFKSTNQSFNKYSAFHRYASWGKLWGLCTFKSLQSKIVKYPKSLQAEQIIDCFSNYLLKHHCSRTRDFLNRWAKHEATVSNILVSFIRYAYLVPSIENIPTHLYFCSNLKEAQTAVTHIVSMYCIWMYWISMY